MLPVRLGEGFRLNPFRSGESLQPFHAVHSAVYSELYVSSSLSSLCVLVKDNCWSDQGDKAKQWSRPRCAWVVVLIAVRGL